MPAQCCKMFGRMTLQHSIGSQTNFWTYTTKDTSTGIQSNCWKGSCLSTGWICTTFNAVASNLYPWCFHVVCCVSMFTLHDSTLTIYFEEAVGGLADRVEVSLRPHNGPPPLPIWTRADARAGGARHQRLRAPARSISWVGTV